MTLFYAQPYSIEHTGFYFDSIEKFVAGMEELNKKGCEEVEIQFIEGDLHLSHLAKAASIGQGDIEFWYEELEDLGYEDSVKLCFLLNQGFEINTALIQHEWVCLYPGTSVDYAQELIEDTVEIPESLQYYIDYEAIARDMKLNGEIVEIEDNLIVTNALEF